MSLLSRRVEVFDFYRGPRHWRYTSTDRLVIVEGQDFTSIKGFKRGRIESSQEEGRSGMELTVPLTLPLLSIYRPYPPSERVFVNFKSIRISDGDIRQAWAGVVAGVEEGQKEAKIHCQSLLTAIGGAGLRRCWQVPCPHVLYSSGLGMCNVEQEDHRVDAVPTFTSATTVEHSVLGANGDRHFSGGFMRWQNGTDTEHRFIVSQIGIVANLLTPAIVPPGTSVAFFPGCDHTLQTCDTKFNNAPNYGGQHTIPKRNPMDGSPVF